VSLNALGHSVRSVIILIDALVRCKSRGANLRGGDSIRSV